MILCSSSIWSNKVDWNNLLVYPEPGKLVVIYPPREEEKFVPIATDSIWPWDIDAIPTALICNLQSKSLRWSYRNYNTSLWNIIFVYINFRNNIISKIIFSASKMYLSTNSNITFDIEIYRWFLENISEKSDAIWIFCDSNSYYTISFFSKSKCSSNSIKLWRNIIKYNIIIIRWFLENLPWKEEFDCRLSAAKKSFPTVFDPYGSSLK